MRAVLTLPLFLVLGSCNTEKPKADATNAVSTPAENPLPALAPVSDIKTSLVRINSTQQSWNQWQPWEKNPPRKRRALAAIVAPGQVLTTSELVSDATYLEFESADGTRFTPAKVIAVDYEANLALLGAAEEDKGAEFFKGSTPVEIANPPKIGDTMEIIQIEENGVALRTAGALQSIDVESNFLPGNFFLTYMVKASMQSAASSYSLPVLTNGKLAGVLISYNSKDQICDVASTDIISRFLKAAGNGTYKGFPSLGVAIARTEDSSFRQWLGLTDDQGGVFIRSVRKGGAADAAGVKKGDVLLAVDGLRIDRRGYYEHPHYGTLSWGHLIRGERGTGDSVTLSLLREGKPLELKATLSREEDSTRLVPNEMFDKAPAFLVKGGLLFQELSRPLLESFGEDWQSRAPLDLLDAYENPENYQDKANRIVFLSGVIPTPATVGYERLRNLVVKKVNGKEVKDMKGLVAAFEGNKDGLHSIEFSGENLTVNLDEAVSTSVDTQLLQRGITRLSRVD